MEKEIPKNVYSATRELGAFNDGTAEFSLSGIEAYQWEDFFRPIKSEMIQMETAVTI